MHVYVHLAPCSCFYASWYHWAVDRRVVSQEKVIPVDLSEMAEFIAVVQNRFVFLTCVSRCQLQFVGQKLECNPIRAGKVSSEGVSVSGCHLCERFSRLLVSHEAEQEAQKLHCNATNYMQPRRGPEI